MFVEDEGFGSSVGLSSFYEDVVQYDGVDYEFYDVLYNEDQDGQRVFFGYYAFVKINGYLDFNGEKEGG